MRIPAPNKNTQSNRPTENTPNSNPATNPGNAMENQKTVQERIESIISKIESFQNNFAKITTKINALADAKESHDAALKYLDYELKTHSKSIDGNAWLQECVHHKQHSMHIQAVMNMLSHEKHFIENPLENAKIELAKYIDEPKSEKMDAIHEREIEYLLSIANQKIAAADFSIAADKVTQAQRDFSNIKYLPGLPPKDPKEYSTEKLIQALKHNSDNTVSPFVKSNIEEIIKDSEFRLNEEKTKLDRLEKNLQESTLAVEKAKVAWDQCILNPALPSSTDDALSTTPAPSPMTGDHQEIDATQVYEQAIATGVDAHVELI